MQKLYFNQKRKGLCEHRGSWEGYKYLGKWWGKKDEKILYCHHSDVEKALIKHMYIPYIKYTEINIKLNAHKLQKKIGKAL